MLHCKKAAWPPTRKSAIFPVPLEPVPEVRTVQTCFFFFLFHWYHHAYLLINKPSHSPKWLLIILRYQSVSSTFGEFDSAHDIARGGHFQTTLYERKRCGLVINFVLGLVNADAPVVVPVAIMKRMTTFRRGFDMTSHSSRWMTMLSLSFNRKAWATHVFLGAN